MKDYKLRKNLEQYKIIIQKIKDPVYLFNSYGSVILENDAGIPYYDSLVGEITLLEYMKHKVNDLNSDLNENASNFELSINKNGEIKHFSVSITPYSYDETEERFIFFFRDKTKEVNYYKDIEENSEFKDLMISTVSHDIRTPLNCSITMTKLSLELTNDTVLKNNLNYSLKSSKFLLAIVNDLLDYSQMNAKKFLLNFDFFVFQEVIDELRIFFESLIHGKNVIFEVFTNFDISTKFYSDKDRIERVLINFISNALKFTKEGYIRLRIMYDSVSQKIEMSVEDSGIGISNEDQKKLFKLWGKLDREDTNRHGIGLGLTISNMIVCSLKNISTDEIGIKVESEVERGTIFKFDFLINRVSNERSINRLLPRRKSQVFDINELIENSNFSKKNEILVIEDEETNIHVMKTLIERAGLNYEICRNGAEAIQIILEAFEQEIYYPLIISDINMPVMDGFKFAKWYRKFEIENKKFISKIVACSANISNKDKDLYYEAGFEEFLEKPIEFNKLDEVLKNFFNNK